MTVAWGSTLAEQRIAAANDAAMVWLKREQSIAEAEEERELEHGRIVVRRWATAAWSTLFWLTFIFVAYKFWTAA